VRAAEIDFNYAFSPKCRSLYYARRWSRDSAHNYSGETYGRVNYDCSDYAK